MQKIDRQSPDGFQSLDVNENISGNISGNKKKAITIPHNDSFGSFSDSEYNSEYISSSETDVDDTNDSMDTNDGILKFINGEIIAIVGKRNEGKTTYTINKIYRDLCMQLDNVHVYCSQTNIDDYSQITDNIHSHSSKNILNEILQMDNKTLLIIDDSVYTTISTVLREIISTCILRHVTLVVIFQFIQAVSPSIRSMFDYLLFHHDEYMSNKKRIYDWYFGRYYKKYDDFVNMYDKLKQYEFIVYTNKKTSHVVVTSTKIYNKHKFIKSRQTIPVNININSVTIKELINDSNKIINDIVLFRTKLKQLKTK